MNIPTTTRVRFLSLALALPLLFPLLGCGTPEWGGPVSGRVSFEGKALPSGAVTFIDAKGRVGSCAIEKDGTYRIDKPPFAECKIMVMTVPPTGDKPDPLLDQPLDPALAPPAPGGWMPIPEKYFKAETTPLSFSVKVEPQSYDIDLKP